MTSEITFACPILAGLFHACLPQAGKGGVFLSTVLFQFLFSIFRQCSAELAGQRHLSSREGVRRVPRASLFENAGTRQEHAVTKCDETGPGKRNDKSVAGLGLMLPLRPMLLPLLLVFGIPIFGVLGILSYARSYSRRIKDPLTSVESLRGSSPFDSNTPRGVRLSRRGAVLALMSTAFGVVGLFVSSAACYKIAIAGLSMQNIPVVVTVLMLDCAVLVFPWLLLTDRKLIREGKFSVGVVVNARVGGIYSFGIIYDFLDDSGHIVRGGSLRRVFTANWSGFGVGSRVPIVYLPEDPSRNSLYVSMAWTVDPGNTNKLL